MIQHYCCSIYADGHEGRGKVRRSAAPVTQGLRFAVYAISGKSCKVGTTAQHWTNPVWDKVEVDESERVALPVSRP